MTFIDCFFRGTLIIDATDLRASGLEACKSSRTDIDTRVSTNICSAEILGRPTILLIVASSFLGANLGVRVLRALFLRELSFGGGGIGAEGVAAVAEVEGVPPVADVPREYPVSHQNS